MIIYQYSLYFIISMLFLSSGLLAQQASNVTLFDQANRGDSRYSGSWAYFDEKNNREYALVGARTGTAIYDIEQAPIVEVGFIPGPSSNWREITVLGKYAYVTTEGGAVGMQIIDLSVLPNAPVLANTYSTTFSTGHILQRDIYSEAPYVYVMGVCNNCGVNILNVSEPANPVEVSTYSPGYYIHDAHVKGDYLYAAAFFRGVIDIVDISDKANPSLVAQIEDPGGNTHSAWVTEDNRHLIICDEADGLPARIWNIEDLNNLYEVSTYTANIQSLVHNPYVRGDYSFFSHNTEGLRVVDIKDPSLPVEVGFYDTYQGSSGGFRGLWSACPYFPSGKIIGGDRTQGLFVWTFNNQQAGRFYATIKDAKSGEVINNASIFIEELNEFLIPDLKGNYKFGSLPQKLNIDVSADGYENSTLAIDINAGDSLELEILLMPKSVGLFSINQVVHNLKITPNPFNNMATIDLKDFEQSEYLEIHNMIGQTVLGEKVGNKSILQLHKKQLGKGLYIIMLYDTKQRIIGQGKLSIVD